MRNATYGKHEDGVATVASGGTPAPMAGPWPPIIATVEMGPLRPSPAAALPIGSPAGEVKLCHRHPSAHIDPAATVSVGVVPGVVGRPIQQPAHCRVAHVS